MDKSEIKIGDVVTRMLGGSIPMKLTVTELTDKIITCHGPLDAPGPGAEWTFDRLTGAEIDADLGWGPGFTGSFLRFDLTEKKQ